jgi:hypothetical protein
LRIGNACGLAAADGDCDGREFRRGVKTAQYAQRRRHAQPDAGQDHDAAFRIGKDLRMCGNGLGDRLTGDIANLGKMTKARRARIDVAALEFFSRRMPLCGVVDFIKSPDILDIDNRLL